MASQDQVNGTVPFTVITPNLGEVDINAFVIIPQEDTVLATLEVNGISIMSSKNLDSYTLRQGAYMQVAEDENSDLRFTKINVTSGSVLAYSMKPN